MKSCCYNENLHMIGYYHGAMRSRKKPIDECMWSQAFKIIRHFEPFSTHAFEEYNESCEKNICFVTRFHLKSRTLFRVWRSSPTLYRPTLPYPIFGYSIHMEIPTSSQSQPNVHTWYSNPLPKRHTYVHCSWCFIMETYLFGIWSMLLYTCLIMPYN